MKSPNSANFPGLEDKTFLLLVIVVSLAFAWILWPFFGAILWGTILAILFAPLYRRLVDFMKQRRAMAALATVTIVLLIVILPLTLIGALLVQEGLGVYEKIQSGELNPGRYFQQVLGALPSLGKQRDRSLWPDKSWRDTGETVYGHWCRAVSSLPPRL